ncbi:hypothetical protein [Reichenbachiella sp. MALMAid0571]|uniref:hypothetical protein n=1 Tax=Reichenbachiella sp. MALMAid0571 TaxID=3143939 RepID=UPI0032DE3FC4
MNRSAFLLTTFLLTSIFISGCSKDEKEDVLKSLIGDWNASSVNVSECIDEDDNGETTCNIFCFELSFNDDGSYSMLDSRETGNPTTTEGTFTVTDSDIIFCETNGDCSRRAFSLDKRNLTLTYSDEDGCTFTEPYAKS